MTAAIVLAAGAGRRLGGRNKALLPVGAGSALRAVADCARRAGVSEIAVVVAAPHLEETLAEAERLGLDTVRNAHPERGMGSSVAVGFAHALERFAADVALLWPVDHFRVRPDTVVQLVERAGAERVVIPVRGGEGGHPPAIGRALWPALVAGADAEGGAREVLRGEKERVERLEVDDIGILRDADVPEDLD